MTLRVAPEQPKPSSFNPFAWLYLKYSQLIEYPEKFQGSSITISTVGSLSVDEHCEWECRMKKKYPIRWFFNTWLYFVSRDIKSHLNSAIWWIRYRTINRNHVLKTSTLEPGWHDRDTRMLHMNFQILVDYIELELGRKTWKFASLSRRDPEGGLRILDWEINEPECQHGPAPTQADVAEIKKFLYRWWTQARPRRYEPWIDKTIWGDEVKYDPIPGNRASYLENLYGAEDQQMLELLIKIRCSLWT